ncbi:MAG: hypothetical protein ACPHDT_11025 [Acidimicrobiales bacterium]
MQAHQLVDLELDEVSGVDHPASLVEGWLVMKADDPISDAFADLITDQEKDTVEETHVADPVVEPVADEALAKELGDLRKALTDMTEHFEKAAAERDALAESAEIEKAAAKVAAWDQVPGMTDEFVPVLRSLNDDQRDAVSAVFDACQIAFAEADVTKELGTDAPGDGDALSTIETLAKGLVAEGKANNIHQAIAAVAADRPDLYAAYVGEKG